MCRLQAQLGDSRLSPDVGHLVLTTLCPALHALVADGLKPFRKDLITGQRRSSPWSVVEASVKPGGRGGAGGRGPGPAGRGGAGPGSRRGVRRRQQPRARDPVQPGQPPGAAEQQPQPLSRLHPGPPQVSGRFPGAPPTAQATRVSRTGGPWRWGLVALRSSSSPTQRGRGAAQP